MANIRAGASALVEHGRRAIRNAQTSPYRLVSYTAVYAATQAAYGWSSLPARDTLPEPIDIQDHIGNMPESMLAGGVVGYLAAEIVANAVLHPNAVARPGRETIRRRALAAAMFAGMVANTFAETKFGQRIAGIDDLAPVYVPNQSVVDFMWGVGAAVLGGALVVRPNERK